MRKFIAVAGVMLMALAFIVVQPQEVGAVGKVTAPSAIDLVDLYTDTEQLAEALGMASAECTATVGRVCDECFDCWILDLWWDDDVLVIFWDCECQGGAEAYRITDSAGTNFCSPH